MADTDIFEWKEADMFTESGPRPDPYPVDEDDLDYGDSNDD